jgi:hypothetical protein
MGHLLGGLQEREREREREKERNSLETLLKGKSWEEGGGPFYPGGEDQKGRTLTLSCGGV